MGKLLIVYLLFRLLGHPIIALIALIVIYYFVDRRYFGFLPNIMRPFRRYSRQSNLKKVLALNPHDMSARYELAGMYLERGQYQRAQELLEELSPSMKETPDVQYDLGTCYLEQGDTDTGEMLILQALEQNARLRHGEPYIRLAGAFAETDAQKALQYARQASEQNVSSCQAYYQLGEVYERLGDRDAARRAYRDCVNTYFSLPRFRQRHERKWAMRARMKRF